MTLYRKKPVVIEAHQWDGTYDGALAILDWIAKDTDSDTTASVVEDGHDKHAYLAIDTLEGTMEVSPGDFVIRGVQGEHYPCKPDIFHETYEKASASEQLRHHFGNRGVVAAEERP